MKPRGSLSETEHLSFVCALVYIAVSGALILLINHMTRSFEIRMRSSLTQRLWGFTPDLVGRARLDFYLWNWRKLVLAGSMICSLLFSLILRFSSLYSAAAFALPALLIWITALLVGWFVYILPKVVLKSPTPPLAMKKEDLTRKLDAASNSWSKKILSRDILEDERLPVTIVTGYLGSGKVNMI